MTRPSNAADAMLAEALKALNSEPERAEALCRALLQADADNGDAKLVLSEALRRQGDLAGAQALAHAEVKRRPQWFGAHRQLGVILAELGEPLPASIALRAAAELNPGHPTIWRELGDQLGLAGDAAGAQSAYARHAAAPVADPNLLRAARALSDNDVAAAEPVLNAHLARFPTDVTALRMLSEAQARAGRPDKAEATLRRVLDLAPTFGHARHSLAQLLTGLGRPEEARAEAERLLRQNPGNTGSKRLLASIFNNLGEFERAAEIYESLLQADPRHAPTWLSYGHMLKTLGRTAEAIAAYRKCIARQPRLGEAYWSLANLKTFRFGDDDIAQMRAQLGRADLTATDRVNFLYALGKALEDAGKAAEAFAHYSEGAALNRRSVEYNSAQLSAFVDRSVEVLRPDFFAARAESGCKAPDPIFIVGLPRAGSTLVEQILASHSAVEGTMELPDLQNVARDMVDPDRAAEGATYLDVLPDIDGAALTALGERYLRTTQVQRKQGRAYFIDKMPNNWAHVGLIQLILPHAKIIDARRHPMACGWSCFKQHFALGQSFTYDLRELGAYYAAYVRLMAHHDAVLPGRVHRVIHEQLVSDPEPHIRALLDYCGLPFEEACLRPHETERAVRTASSEQVRRPISAKGLDDWRAFEPWLGPLKQALGEVLEAYPEAPRYGEPG